MKRHLSLLAAAALALTACTDQPLPADTRPTPSDLATTDATASATPLPSDERVARMIARITEQHAADVLTTGALTIEPLNTAIGLSPDDLQEGSQPAETRCEPLPAPNAQVTAYGDVVTEDSADTEDPENPAPQTQRGLGAWGFSTGDQALDFTNLLLETVENCTSEETEMTVLTHHTDEAHQIQRPTQTDDLAQAVVIRDDRWVLVHTSTPATDVALSLTVIDQLTEMLR